MSLTVLGDTCKWVTPEIINRCKIIRATSNAARSVNGVTVIGQPWKTTGAKSGSYFVPGLNNTGLYEFCRADVLMPTHEHMPAILRDHTNILSPMVVENHIARLQQHSIRYISDGLQSIPMHSRIYIWKVNAKEGDVYQDLLEAADCEIIAGTPEPEMVDSATKLYKDVNEFIEFIRNHIKEAKNG